MFTSKEIIIEVIEKIVTKEVLIKDVAYAKSAVFMLE